MGANWIHGVLGNPIFEIALQNGLVSIVNVPKPHKVVAATEQGYQVPFTFLHEIYAAYVCFLRRCDEYFLCQYIPPLNVNSVGEHINLEIELYLKSVQDPKEKRLKMLIFNCLLKRETCITGCHSMHDIDLIELGSYTELQGGNIVPQSGYSSILNTLTAQLPKTSIITKCPVKRIYWKRTKTATGLETLDEYSESDTDESQKTVKDDCEGAVGGKIDNANINAKRNSYVETTEALKNDDSVRIICEDGRVFNADHVICTIPLGVLKERHKNLFNPKLPLYKQESIDALMFGTVDKIFLEYERPFLSVETSEIMLLWDDENQYSSSNTDSCSEEFFSKNWYKKIYSFAKISETLLLGWISGKEAEFMETLSHEEIGNKCTEILRLFLKDECVPKPRNCVW